MSNSAVESSWKVSSFLRPVSHEYPALATEGLWRKQAHNNWERFVTTGVKWMKPRGSQVMQFMETEKEKGGKKRRRRRRNTNPPQLLHRSIHHSLRPSRNVLTDTKRFVWHCASELEWLLLAALFPNSRAPSSGGCTAWLRCSGSTAGWLGMGQNDAPALWKQFRGFEKQHDRKVFRSHIKPSLCLN